MVERGIEPFHFPARSARTRETHNAGSLNVLRNQQHNEPYIYARYSDQEMFV
jgi:hypothetical protein